MHLITIYSLDPILRLLIVEQVDVLLRYVIPHRYCNVALVCGPQVPEGAARKNFENQVQYPKQSRAKNAY